MQYTSPYTVISYIKFYLVHIFRRLLNLARPHCTIIISCQVGLFGFNIFPSN